MRELANSEIKVITGGMSDKMWSSLEGGALGILEGAIVGGVVTWPIYSMITSINGVSSSSQAIGMVIVLTGVSLGAMGGAVFGTCTGYIAGCLTCEEITD